MATDDIPQLTLPTEPPWFEERYWLFLTPAEARTEWGKQLLGVEPPPVSWTDYSSAAWKELERHGR